MQAAGKGQQQLPQYTHAPPAHIKAQLEGWLAEHRIEEPTSDTANVVTRHYAGNGVFGAVPELVKGLPELAAVCVGVKGLECKPQWDPRVTAPQ